MTNFSLPPASSCRTGRVARSYWRCLECGASYGLEVADCLVCSGQGEQQARSRRPVRRLGHWLTLLVVWAAATVLWAAASGLFAARA